MKTVINWHDAITECPENDRTVVGYTIDGSLLDVVYVASDKLFYYDGEPRRVVLWADVPGELPYFVKFLRWFNENGKEKLANKKP